MKLEKIKINAFGNIQNREINLEPNINIIYGKNEAGKSTLLKFITSMLYGVSKNKRGKEISDYEKYKPWNSEEFSGKIEYRLDNGEFFTIYRDFKKKNPKILNQDLEDVSALYHVDKTKGSDFFTEQTKIDEDLFLSTVASLQQEVKLDKNAQNTLLQKITNLVSSGDDTISYQKVVDQLNKKLLEEVGTERSQGRPLNIISARLEQLKQEKNALEQERDDKLQIEEKLANQKEEVEKQAVLLALLKQKKQIELETMLAREKIKAKIETKAEESLKTRVLMEQVQEKKKEKEEINKRIKIKEK